LCAPARCKEGRGAVVRQGHLIAVVGTLLIGCAVLLLLVVGCAGPLEPFLLEFGEPVSDPSSPPEGEPDMDKLQASAQRTGGIEFV
jgi:hypothetical protein